MIRRARTLSREITEPTSFPGLVYSDHLSWNGTATCLSAALAMSGCAAAFEPVVVALAGTGTSTVIGHSSDGTVYRTFTASLAEVKAASLQTLSLMDIRVDGLETTDERETITAKATRRSVNIDLEPISSNVTRMKVVVKSGGSIFYDGDTATEMVLQVERALRKN